jgi:hypothetical protein
MSTFPFHATVNSRSHCDPLFGFCLWSEGSIRTCGAILGQKTHPAPHAIAGLSTVCPRWLMQRVMSTAKLPRIAIKTIEESVHRTDFPAGLGRDVSASNSTTYRPAVVSRHIPCNS